MMKKEDIIAMKTAAEIMGTLKTHSHLWDEEVNEHLKTVARKEHADKYGNPDVYVDYHAFLDGSAFNDSAQNKNKIE